MRQKIGIKKSNRVLGEESIKTYFEQDGNPAHFSYGHREVAIHSDEYVEFQKK